MRPKTTVDEGHMNLKTFLATIKLYWKTFVTVTLALLAAGLTLLFLAPTQYVSTAQLLVSVQGSTTATAYQNDDVVTGRVNSYIALLTSDAVSQRVIDKLGLPLTAPAFAAKVSATNVPPNTSIIDVAVTDTSPQQARRLADTLTTEFVSYTDALETPTGEDGQKVRTTVVTSASEPQPRTGERVVLGILAAAAALLLGAVAVWIRSLTDPLVRTAERACATANMPVIGHVTTTPAASAAELEAYRRLRTQLRDTAGGDVPCVLEIASVEGDGDVLVIASNLGRVLELAGRRSVVLDAGLPSGVAECAPDTGPTNGVVGPDRSDSDDGNGDLGDADTDSGDATASDEIESTQLEHGPDGFPDTVSVPTWAIEPDSIMTIATEDLFDRLRDNYPQLIVAAPPVLSTIAASVLSDYADAVMLAVSSTSTRRRDLRQAVKILNATGSPLIGLVFLCQVNRYADGS